jgi:hypothetical protein
MQLLLTIFGGCAAGLIGFFVLLLLLLAFLRFEPNLLFALFGSYS